MGEFYGSTNNGFIKPKITWQAQQFPEENYSLVTATLHYSRTNTGYVTSGTWAGGISIGGDGKQESRYLSISYNSDTVAISHTARVNHNTYGEAKVEILAWGGIPGTTLESTSILQVVALDTIPLASTVAATDAFVEAVCMVAVSRKNADYTHSIALACNGLEGYLTADGKLADTEQMLTETAIAFAVPALFYGYMQDCVSAQVQLTCRTYHGQTPVGLPQKTAFTLTARESLCAPAAELTAEDVEPKTLALTGDKGVLVRYASKARCTLSAQARNGAAVVAQRICGVETQDGALEFAAVENGLFTASVTDSRGYTTQAQVTLPVVPYIQLTVNASAKRTDPTSGKAILTVWGNFYDGSFGAQDNILTLDCRVGDRSLVLAPLIADGSYRAEVLVEELDYTKTHYLTVVGQDAVMKTEAMVTVKPGIPVFDWSEKDFAFHVPISVEGKQLWEIIYPVGSIYMSVAETEPAVLFGGRWERLKDRFLLAAGDSYPAGQTGGEAEHVLKTDELPSHSHGLNGWALGMNGVGGTRTYALAKPWTEYNNFEENGEQTIQSTGGDLAHNNMPPYLAVYMWKRVA